MKFNPAIHHRRSVRLKGYDYFRAGACFVTRCCEGRNCLFGEVMDGGMRLNAAGEMIQVVWRELPENYPDVDIAEFVIMPNHVHGIIVIVGASPRGCPYGAGGVGAMTPVPGRCRPVSAPHRNPGPARTRTDPGVGAGSGATTGGCPYGAGAMAPFPAGVGP